MELNRRDFLKLGGASIAGATAFGAMGSATALAAPKFREFPLKKKVNESTTICCYCSVGCCALVTTYEDGIIKVEDDPDHLINEGALCPKGQAMGPN